MDPFGVRSASLGSRPGLVTLAGDDKAELLVHPTEKASFPTFES